MLSDEKGLVDKFITDDINPQNGLDLGCGPAKKTGTNHDCQEFRGILTGVDSNRDFEPDICCNILDLNGKIKAGSMKLIVLSHTLEDMENPYDCLRLLIDLLARDGVLVIICPYRNKYHRIGTKGANMGHKYDFEPHDVEYMVWKCFGQLKKNFSILSKDSLDNRYSFELVVKKQCDAVGRRVGYGFTHMWKDDGGDDPRYRK